MALDIGYRVDLLVEGRVIVEVKAVETILPVHEAQLLSYPCFPWLRIFSIVPHFCRA